MLISETKVTMDYTGQDVGSISNRYEVQLLEIGKTEPTTEKLLTVFTVLEDVIPQLGVFKKVKDGEIKRT